MTRRWLDSMARGIVSGGWTPSSLAGSVAERTLQGITQDRAFLDNRFALKIAITRERERSMCDVKPLPVVLQVENAPVFDRFNDLRRLVSELLRKLSMALLH